MSVICILYGSIDVKFSIIIPVYNAERYIRQCIESVLDQTFQDFELILVNDGSVDKSANIINEYVDDSRIIIIHKENEGVSSARNRGLDVAQGEWVSFVDSDDVLEDSCLENFEKIERKGDINFFSSVDFYDDFSMVKRQMPDGFYEGNDSIQKIIYYLKSSPGFEFFGVTWNKFFRNDIIQKNHLRFDCRISYREDELFTSNFLLYASSVTTMSAIGYRYRKTACGLHKVGQNALAFEILADAICSYIGGYTNPELKKRECTRAVHLMFRAYMMEKDELRSRQISKKMLLTCRNFRGNLLFSKSILLVSLISKINLTGGVALLSVLKKLKCGDN
ncbi:glycosyltransferase [Candidatus Saccharibacteria bacterium]|nr:glycosyltransferase [Candidatus Saccharibacteria bacterium]